MLPVLHATVDIEVGTEIVVVMVEAIVAIVKTGERCFCKQFFREMLVEVSIFKHNDIVTFQGRKTTTLQHRMENYCAKSFLKGWLAGN